MMYLDEKQGALWQVLQLPRAPKIGNQAEKNMSLLLATHLLITSSASPADYRCWCSVIARCDDATSSTGDCEWCHSDTDLDERRPDSLVRVNV